MATFYLSVNSVYSVDVDDNFMNEHAGNCDVVADEILRLYSAGNCDRSYEELVTFEPENGEGPVIYF